jgi:hypothetical protein
VNQHDNQVLFFKEKLFQNHNTTRSASNILLEPRIAYQLRWNVPYDNPFSPIYTCPIDNNTTFPLPPILHEKGILDFTTTISTNLRVLTMGDSVGILFAQSLENAAGASGDIQTQVCTRAWR